MYRQRSSSQGWGVEGDGRVMPGRWGTAEALGGIRTLPPEAPRVAGRREEWRESEATWDGTAAG